MSHLEPQPKGEAASTSDFFEICNFCFEKIVPEEWLKHHEKCEEVPLVCPNQCDSDPLKRCELENHIKNFCPNTMVNCLFKGVGCQYKERRRNIDKHISENQRMHIYLMCEEINKLKNCGVNQNGTDVAFCKEQVNLVTENQNLLNNAGREFQKALANEHVIVERQGKMILELQQTVVSLSNALSMIQGTVNGQKNDIAIIGNNLLQKQKDQEDLKAKTAEQKNFCEDLQNQMEVMNHTLSAMSLTVANQEEQVNLILHK